MSSETTLNTEQLAAVEATGRVFVSAGAGTGKTSVLVERFVRAVCDAGYDVEPYLRRYVEQLERSTGFRFPKRELREVPA